MAHWIHKRAGGRRRYNADRQGKAWQRRIELAERFGLIGLLHKTGAQAAAAAYFNVSPATICRDVWAVARWAARDSQREEGQVLRLMMRDVTPTHQRL